MRRSRLSLPLILLLAACRPTPEPVPTLLPTPVVQAQPTPAVIPTLADDPQGGLPDLEPLSAQNAARLVALAKSGEGIFQRTLRLSPDGQRLAIAAAGGVVLVDAANGRRVSFLPIPNPVETLAFSPDGSRLALTYRLPQGEIYQGDFLTGLPIDQPLLAVYELSGGRLVYQRGLAGGGCAAYAAWDLAYSPDGSRLYLRDQYSLAGQGRSAGLCLFDAASGALQASISVEAPWTASAAAFSSPGDELYLALTDYSAAGPTPPIQVRVYSAADGRPLRSFDGGVGPVNRLALSPDGQSLALAGSGGARLISAQDGRLQANLAQGDTPAMTLAFTPGGGALAVGTQDGAVSLWSLPAGQRLWQAPAWVPDPSRPAESPAADLAFSPAGDVVYALYPTLVVDTPGWVDALSAADGRLAYRVFGVDTVCSPALSPDHTQAAFGGYADGALQVRTAGSGGENRLLYELPGGGQVLAVTYAPDGRQIAAGGMDGRVRLWSAADGARQAELDGGPAAVRALAYTPDGSRLAASGDDATLRVWDTHSGSLLQTLAIQTGSQPATALAFSPDGTSLILASGCAYGADCPSGPGGLLRIDLADGSVHPLLSGRILQAAFSADRSIIAITGDQGIQTGQIQAGQAQFDTGYTSPLGNGALSGAALTPDGRLFLSGNVYGLQIWQTGGSLLAVARGSAPLYGTLRVTPDQQVVTTADWSGMLALWGVPRGGG